jgi:Holliday junction resolvase
MRNNRGKFRTLDGKRIIEAGLSAPGSSDLIGWRSVTVTPDMVGQKIAVYCAVEVKTDKGRVSPEQQKFVDNVSAAGGYAVIARSEADLRNQQFS